MRDIVISKPVQIAAGVLGMGIVGMLAWPSVSAEFRRSADWAHAAQIDAARAAGAAEFSGEDAGGWSAYRGPRRDGLSAETGLLATWPDGGPPEVWRVPVGGGHAGVAIEHGRVYTLEQRRDDEVLAAYDLATGAELWSHGWPARFSEAAGGDGPRSTPTVHDGSVYAYGAHGHLVAVDALTGERRWSHEVLEELELANLQWGLASSPLVVDGMVVVATSGIDGPGLIAFDAASGEEKWITEWMPQGYVSPTVEEIGGVRQIMHFAGSSLIGLDIATGDVRWSHAWKTFRNITASQPVRVGSRVLISSGYGVGSRLVDVEDDNPSVVWESQELACHFNSPVVLDGTIYALSDNHLVAHDFETGARRWKGFRFGAGQLMAADGGLIVVGEGGTVGWVLATPESYQEQGRVKALQGRTWAVPGLAGGRLVVRNEREMVAYDLRR